MHQHTITTPPNPKPKAFRLPHTATSTAAFAFPDTLDTNMTSIALIGSGIFVKEEHLPAVKATPSLTLKAIYSRSLKSAKGVAADASDVELYSEDQEGRKYEDLLKREDISAVIIA
jgi:hypothetical protein